MIFRMLAFSSRCLTVDSRHLLPVMNNVVLLLCLVVGLSARQAGHQGACDPNGGPESVVLCRPPSCDSGPAVCHAKMAAFEIQTEERWGSMPDGAPVARITIASTALKFSVVTFGATVQTLMFNTAFLTSDPPNFQHVALGYDTLEEYLADEASMGCTVGRFINRIQGGKFPYETVDGHERVAELPRNNHGNTLHSGPNGLSRRLWTYEVISGPERAGVVMKILSPDGDDGFPGAVTVYAGFFVTKSNPATLELTFEATHDSGIAKSTPLNIGNHLYWNLDGMPSVLSHTLRVDADFYCVVNNNTELIPTGEIRSVSGTPLDFRSPVPLFDGVDSPFFGSSPGGFDSTLVLRPRSPTTASCASLYSPISGVRMDVATTYPTMQIYSSNFLKNVSSHGKILGFRSALCMETQFPPNAPNIPHVQFEYLPIGGRYSHVTTHSFSHSKPPST